MKSFHRFSKSDLQLYFTFTLIFIYVIPFTSTTLTKCPDNCGCVVFTINSQPQNFLRCLNISAIENITDSKIIDEIYSIDLSGLNLTKITNEFNQFDRLKRLDLSDNKLTEIHNLPRRIDWLNLAENRLTSGKLSKIVPNDVKHLNLSHNQITHLPIKLKNLLHLRTIELTGNRINCTCETLKVRDHFQKLNIGSENPIVCAYPLTAKGKSWLQIKKSHVCDYSELDSSDFDRNNNENKFDWDEYDENDLMLGDEPVYDGSGEHSNDDLKNGDLDDEIGKDYLPVDDSKSLTKFNTDDIEDDDNMASGNMDVPVELLSNKNTDDDHDVATDAMFEGSGGIIDVNAARSPLESSTTSSQIDEYDEDYDGSGSGAGAYIGPGILMGVDSKGEPNKSDDFDDHNKDNDNDEEDDDDPLSPPLDVSTEYPIDLKIFSGGMGIHRFEPDNKPSETPVIEETVKKIESDPLDTERIKEEITETKKDNIVSENTPGIAEKNENDNRNTYILLVILGVLLVCLIVFVVVRQKKAKKRNRRGKHDIENPVRGTELLEMDKKSLGKPVLQNANAETVPLMSHKSNNNTNNINNNNNNNMNNKHKPNITPSAYKNPSDASNTAEEPLLKKLDPADEMKSFKPITVSPPTENDVETKQPIPEKRTSVYENVPDKVKQPESNDIGNENEAVQTSKPISQQEPIVPVHQQSPTTSPVTPIQNGHRIKPNNYVDNDNDEVFQPVSPRPARYSPVYSPETGRVKIKLTETPKPNRPVMVTRSRSNAGEMITTPNLNVRPPNDGIQQQ